MDQNTATRVHKLVVDRLGVEPTKVQPGVRLIPEDHAAHHWGTSGGGDGDLGADSLDVVELVMAVEDEFGIEIPDDDVVTRLNTGTVGDLVALVDAKLALRAA